MFILRVFKVFCVFHLLFSCVGFYSQCNTASFTAVKTNGTCSSNGAIDISVPGGVACSGWVAILTLPSGLEQSTPILADGTSAGFHSLKAGSYSVRLYNGLTTVQASNNPIVVTTGYVSPVRFNK
jgi:hypothetical protein